MLIQLQPTQISAFWGNIKKSVFVSNKVPTENQGKYGNRLLKNLLSGKYQCWVCVKVEDGEKKLVAIGVTALIEEHMYDAKTLFCLSIYGFRKLNYELASDAFDKLKSYARRNRCDKITMQTSNKRMQAIIEEQGLTVSSKLYESYL